MSYVQYPGLTPYENIMKNHDVFMKKLNSLEQIIDFFPRLTEHKDRISYQRACHAIAEALGNYEESWDLEVQRNTPFPPYISENNWPFYIGHKCNYNSWADNRLLFYPELKFNGIDVYPNMWVHYTNSKTDKLEYYYVDENYVGVTGWKYVDAWYYFNDFAVMQTGWLDYNNQWYYLDTNGRMQTGIQKINEKYYAFKRDTGEMYHSKWIEDNGKWYYSKDSNGDLSINKWEEIDNKWYYFNHDATMKTGWLDYNDHWYYLEDSGVMVTGWQDIGESRYYFKSSGEMLTGVHTIDGIEYEFNNSGHLVRRGKFPTNPPVCNKYTCIMPYSNDKGVSE